MNRDDRTPPEAPRRLVWDDEGEGLGERPDEPSRPRTQFALKLARPIYDVRCIVYLEPLPLEWD